MSDEPDWDQLHADAEAEHQRLLAERKALQLDAAKVQREQMLDAITKCERAWPIVVLRNGDGHAPTCPAHKPFGTRSQKGVMWNDYS